MAEMIYHWLSQNYIEVLGAITGLIYLYFSVNKIIWLWPFGIITSILYTWVFFESRLFADMSLQVYYFFISIYGWYYWLKGNGKGKSDDNGGGKHEIPVRRIKQPVLFISLLIIVFLTMASGYFLKAYANSSLPYWDAFTTSASVVATWMLARKLIENWLFWIVID
ncbi:MAG: nicotinamide riboside transporter PnuC, partial [Bacteroidales bacterium]